MIKLAFFDFCETLVSFQTADAYVDYIRNVEGTFYMRFLNGIYVLLCKTRITGVMNKLFPDSAFGKRMKLLQLRGFEYRDLDRLAALYYRDMIKPNQIDTVMSEMKNLVQNGYEICLVSAGYSIYLKYFSDEYKIRHLISTEIGFDKSGYRCLGTISGKDCINLQKVKRIKNYFNDQDINFHESLAYSDSISDLPVLLLAGKGVVVSRSTSQSWSSDHNLKEILWDLK
jgi:HAD superfamily hydrolase (TIGR01490 family)